MAPKDYLEVEYDYKSHPKSLYPEKLAKFIFNKFNFMAGQDLLEIGSGRSEVLAGFVNQGLTCFAVDSAPSAENFAIEIGAKFEKMRIDTSEIFSPFGGKKFDIVFSKSLIEHIEDPISFLNSVRTILKPGGKVITLTPDFESNYKIFYDDITHVKPFTTKTMMQVLKLTNYNQIQVFKFRQLPSTWDSSFFRLLAVFSGSVAHHRVKNKWFRWSRELMIASVGVVEPENIHEVGILK